jgi:hypothetical protein
MRQTATYALPSPWRDIGWQLLLWVAFFIVTCLIDFSCTAHAGQQPTTVVGSRPSIRHTRRMTRITVLRPVRAQGRAAAGYPFLQTTANVSQVAANVTGNLPVSVAIGFIRFIARPATPQTFQGSRPCPQKRR